ncbi:MAG TPA: ABC transporter ATP-binding protein [Steroidobacteraceae bacterium]
MIELRSVNKIFRTKVTETYALRDFDLSVASGEFIAVTGHSGSGKTTLLNVIGLLEEFNSGAYRIEGEDVSELRDDRRSHIRNQKIGFVFQGFNLIPSLSIFDNVEAPLHYRRMPAAERRKRVTSSLERVGLTSRMQHFPGQLSGGQQQRAAIARAIGGDPRVILADEPTGNLDTTMSAQIMDLLQSINAQGTTILIVTHNNELAGRAQRVVHMADGQVGTAAP